MTMTKTPMTNADNADQLRPLSQDEIGAVAGGLKSLGGMAGGTNCFPIFEDDGHGGVIIISPTLGPLGRFPWL
jgi:hypothetical protein